MTIEWSMEGGKRFFRMKTLGQQPPTLNLTVAELHSLYMCRSFAEPELVAWLLSFGDEARLLGQDWLVEKVAETVTRQFEAYVQKN